MDPDRHGRSARTPPDPRRRPEAGFRLRTAARFRQLTADVLATLPDAVRAALRGAEVRHLDVPPSGAVSDGLVPLVRLKTQGTRIAVVEVYRRPLELRAASAADLADLLRLALAREVADALGLDLGEGWDEDY